MAWAAYTGLHSELQRAVAEACIIGRVAEAALRGFPSNVPRDLAEPLARSLRALGEDAVAAAEAAQIGDTVAALKFDDFDPLSLDVSLMITHAFGRGAPPTVEDFGESVRRQQLVTMLAALDAFLGDTIRSICRVRPGVLRCAKTITHDEVVAAGSYEALLAKLTDRIAFEAGWGPLRERLTLPKVFGLDVSFKPTTVDSHGRSPDERGGDEFEIPDASFESRGRRRRRDARHDDAEDRDEPGEQDRASEHDRQGSPARSPVQ